MAVQWCCVNIWLRLEITVILARFGAKWCIGMVRVVLIEIRSVYEACSNLEGYTVGGGGLGEFG